MTKALWRIEEKKVNRERISVAPNITRSISRNAKNPQREILWISAFNATVSVRSSNNFIGLPPTTQAGEPGRRAACTEPSESPLCGYGEAELSAQSQRGFFCNNVAPCFHSEGEKKSPLKEWKLQLTSHTHTQDFSFSELERRKPAYWGGVVELCTEE